MGNVNAQSAVRVLTLADVRLTYVVDGSLWLAPAGFFPGIPASYWEKNPSALAGDRVAMSAGGLLVERHGRKLLIDAGLGPSAGPVAGPDDPQQGSADTGHLPATLAALGHAPEDIEVVAFTHLHADHVGWAFAEGRKFFPQASYLVSEQEWAPHDRGETDPRAPSSPVIGPLGREVTLFKDGDEIFPGVHALLTPGHTPGHTSFVVAAGLERVIAFGDAFHIPAQLTRPDWPSGPDVDAMAVMSSRQRLISELQRPGTIGFGCHFGDQTFGRLSADGVWQPAEAEAVLPPPRP
jgi:glyoxylase-like metal-dependent hydrolase (beta-lactamase superfamily II)